MYQVGVDKSKNLLKITYAQHVGAEDTKRVEEAIPPLMDDVQPGFRLLTDLSSLESMDLACVPYIRRMMDLCNKKGVELVVRVIPDPQKDIGLNILSLFHYRRRVRIVTCPTLEEAMKALEG
jgi:anti-anti-sigma regulatory factor